MPCVRLRLRDREATCDVPLPNSSSLAAIVAANAAAIGLDPNASFALALRGKQLDPRALWRYAGVPTNAVVDVIVDEANSAMESVVLASSSKPVPPSQQLPAEPSFLPAASSQTALPPQPATTTPSLPSPDIPQSLLLSPVAQAVQVFRSQTWDAEAAVALPTLAKIIRNVFSNPAEEKFKWLRANNPALREKLGGSNAAFDVLRSVGFVDVDKAGEPYLVLEKPEEAKVREAHSRIVDLAQQVVGCPAIDSLPSSPMPVVTPPAPPVQQQPSSFDIYRSSVLTTQPRPPALEESPVQIRLDALRERHRALLEATRGVDRHLVVVRPTPDFNPRRFARKAVAVAALGGDDASEGGESDLRALSQHQKEVNERMRKQENFQTKAMREVDELSKVRVFPYCVVRVLLPDRVVVQARFSPLDTVGDVAALVAQVCGLPNSSGFHLLNGPPPVRASFDAVLHATGFMPSAVFQAVGENLVARVENWGSVEDLLEDMPAGVPLVDVPKAEKRIEKPKWLKI